jgi:MFS superfamily sulfate permease-like transporter
VKQEGVAVGRSFAIFKNYHIDGNKEMIAFGMMNIAGSCTSCYLTAGTSLHVQNIYSLGLGLYQVGIFY